MFTFHIESVVADTVSLSAETAHPEVSELCSLVRAAGMHVGITVKPETPVELLFPYVQAGLVDMVREGGGMGLLYVVRAGAGQGRAGRGGAGQGLLSSDLVALYYFIGISLQRRS